MMLICYGINDERKNLSSKWPLQKLLCACQLYNTYTLLKQCPFLCLMLCLTALFSCYRGQDSVKHYTVTASDTGYAFGLAKFASLTEFLQHFQSHPLLGGESGN